MDKQFDKKQFNKKLYTTFAFFGAILLIGIISLVLADSIKGAAYYHNPKNYYGVYESYDYDITLNINEETAVLNERQTETTYKYTYMSPTRVQRDYGKEDGRAGILLYEEHYPDNVIILWLYKSYGQVYLMENVSQIKLYLY